MIDLSPFDRHDRAALSFSGGKDALACLYLLRCHLDRITVYHLDTGDLLPEVRDVVSEVETMCPNFVHIQTDARGWIAEHGYPTDLLPYSAHGVGVAAGQNGVKLITRYQCCFVNLMYPIWERIKADGHTLIIRGTKRVDQKKIPMHNGEMAEGVEFWHPIEDWTHEQVQDYLASVGAPRNPVYDHMTNAPECARCPAWWSENRASYLRRFHPDLFADYAADLKIVAAEIMDPILNLGRELAEVG